MINEAEDFSLLVSASETETQFTPCDKFSASTHTHTHRRVCSSAWDVNEMEIGWTHVLIFCG